MPDQPYDLIVRGGTVIDGTGASGVRADVGVRGGRIGAVGQIEGPARREIDASGRLVTPGFIDVHAHDDDAVMSTPMDFKLMQGVTTDIVGNCGAGMAPRNPERPPMPGVNMVFGAAREGDWLSFGEYMNAVEKSDLTVNVGCFVPHGAVRYAAMGTDRRAPTGDELAQMREHVAEGIAAGALGLSTGLIYPPGAFAETDEIIELSRAAAEGGAIYMSHIRNEAEQLLVAVEEAITIGREAGCPVEISHHKASARSVWGKTADSIAMIEKARADGMDITFDAYPYTAGSTILAAARGVSREIEPDSIIVASVNEHREYEGKTLEQIGEMLGVDDVQEVIARVLSDEPSAVAVFFSMHEDDVRRVLAHPLCMIGSDGIPSPTGKPHPRLYGTFPRILGKYVREEKLVPLEEAVRKMTSLPAQRMNLPDRGELRKGFAADIVVFDPDTIEDLATYEDPRQYPVGIDYVIVNGEVAAEKGAQTPARAGRLLRRGNSG
jgi:N-acyl-D-amino-acid deacylase